MSLNKIVKEWMKFSKFVSFIKIRKISKNDFKAESGQI